MYINQKAFFATLSILACLFKTVNKTIVPVSITFHYYYKLEWRVLTSKIILFFRKKLNNKLSEDLYFYLDWLLD